MERRSSRRRSIRAALLGLLLVWFAPAPAGSASFEEGDLLLVKGSALFHYSRAIGELRVVSSPETGAGPVFENAAGVGLARSGTVVVAAEDVFLVDFETGDRTRLAEGLHADKVRGLRNGTIVSLGYQGSVHRIDPTSGETDMFASFVPWNPEDFDASFDQKLFLRRHAATLWELDPTTGAQAIVSSTQPGTERGLGPDLRDVRFVAAGAGDEVFVINNAGLARVSRLTGDREILASGFLGIGSGPIWWASLTPGLEIDPTARPVVLGRVGAGVLSLVTVDPETLVRTAEPIPEISIEGVLMEAPADFVIVRDADGDGTIDPVDNCLDVSNPDQADTDGNEVGDACNDFEDADGDDYADALDNCPQTANDQSDTDADGVGDACNDADDADGDDFRDDLDNCPTVPNDQVDRDGDGLGDGCDPFPDEPDNEKGQLRFDLAQCLLRPVFLDGDGDGEDDSTDACAETPPNAAVDDAGCSQDQFCAAIDPAHWLALIVKCATADWNNDESARILPGDCTPTLDGGEGLRCVAP